GHQTAPPSTLLPEPRAESAHRDSAESRANDLHPPTTPAADDAPTRSDSESPLPLTPTAAVASDSASPACPKPRPPAPRGAPPSRSTARRWWPRFRASGG